MPADPADAYETPPDGFAIEPIAFECPACGNVVRALPAAVARNIACPACGERMLIPAEDGSTLPPDGDVEGASGYDPDRARAEIERQKADELDGLRMRNVVALRRAAMRSRSYAVIGAGACALGVAKLALMTRDEVRLAGWHARQGAFVAFAVLALVGVVYFLRRAAHWGRESRPRGEGFCIVCGHDVRGLFGTCPKCHTTIPPDRPAPDFSTLSDGTQHARNLEDIR